MVTAAVLSIGSLKRRFPGFSPVENEWESSFFTNIFVLLSALFGPTAGASQGASSFSGAQYKKSSLTARLPAD